MTHTPINLDMARNLLMCGPKQVHLPSRTGALFLHAMCKSSQQVQPLTMDVWQQQLLALGQALPNRSTMRRRLAELDHCFEALGCADSRPAVVVPARGATVGPWRLRHDLCERMVVLHNDPAKLVHGIARLMAVSASRPSQVQLQVMNYFLVGDDLARNGMFVDAAANMVDAIALPDLSIELQCVLHLRIVKYSRRCGQFAKARDNLAQVALLAPGLMEPMRGHIQTELAVQGWRLKYDDVAHAEAYPTFKAPSANAYSDFQLGAIDSRLMWQQFNLWGSEWRRQMEVGDIAAVQMAFNRSQEGYEAAIYWALAGEDALNAMNMVANMGYLLHLSGQRKLADLSVSALDWLLLSQAYIERFEWPEESLWDYVFLAGLYLASPCVRKHLQAHSAYVMNALTPDSHAFYEHAIDLGIRLQEPRQLANMYQLYIRYLQSVGQHAKVQDQESALDALLLQNPGLREKL